MQYAREVFEWYNLDTGQTIAGGPFVDLGGFGSFVYNRDRNRRVRLAFELDLRDKAAPDYTGPYYGPQVKLGGLDTEDLLGQVTSASVAIGIAWSHLENRPYVLVRALFGLPVRDRVDVHEIDLSMGRRLPPGIGEGDAESAGRQSI